MVQVSGCIFPLCLSAPTSGQSPRLSYSPFCDPGQSTSMWDQRVQLFFTSLSVNLLVPCIHYSYLPGRWSSLWNTAHWFKLSSSDPSPACPPVTTVPDPWINQVRLVTHTHLTGCSPSQQHSPQGTTHQTQFIHISKPSSFTSPLTLFPSVPTNLSLTLFQSLHPRDLSATFLMCYC